MPRGKPADIEKLTPKVIDMANNGVYVTHIVKALGLRHWQVKRILIREWGADAYDRRRIGNYLRAAKQRKPRRGHEISEGTR